MSISRVNANVESLVMYVIILFYINLNIAPVACLKLVAGGNGIVSQMPPIRKEIIKLSGKNKPFVVYLGTASYESSYLFELQTAGFVEDGCQVHHLRLNKHTNIHEIPNLINSADIIVVSAGNTLFAMKRLRKFKIDQLLKNAVERGAVLCGGSAGAICWFDAGHSDSRNPTSLRFPRYKLDDPRIKNWKYISVRGLGLVPGIVCPHYDSTSSSNGIPRSKDFDNMLIQKRKRNEIGICIDEYAVIMIVENTWRVLRADNQSTVTIKKVQKYSKNIISEVYKPEDSVLPLKILLGETSSSTSSSRNETSFENFKDLYSGPFSDSNANANSHTQQQN
eukprot:gene3170-6253_t